MLRNIISKVPTGALALAIITTAGAVRAQGPIVDDTLKDRSLATEVQPNGWKVGVSVGASASFAHSHQVVGTEDGAYLQLGGVLGGNATLRHNQHEWENLLDLKLGGTKTPQIDAFVKSTDNFDFASTYLYHLEEPKWLGAYGRLKVGFQLLDGQQTAAQPTELVRIRVNGDRVNESVGAQQQYDLTSSFEPLVLRETVGAFAAPFTAPELTLNAKLGIGAQHILTRRGFVIADDAATPALELKQLDNTHEGGAEFSAAATGVLMPEVLSWKAGVDLFLPVITTSDDDLGVGERLNAQLSAGLSLKLAKWLSLDYVVAAKRIPTILPDWQVTNNLLLTAGFQLL